MKDLKQHITENISSKRILESLRIGINDTPEEDYKYPSGNVNQLDQKVIDLLKYDINCLKPYLQRQNKNTLDNLSQVLNQKMGGRDLHDNDGKRKDVIMDLSKHIIENMFNSSIILYIFNDNMESDKVGEELGNDFFNLFDNCPNTGSEATCYYYLGNDIAMISYRRGIYNYKDFDIFIIRKDLDLN